MYVSLVVANYRASAFSQNLSLLRSWRPPGSLSGCRAGSKQCATGFKAPHTPAGSRLFLSWLHRKHDFSLTFLFPQTEKYSQLSDCVRSKASEKSGSRFGVQTHFSIDDLMAELNDSPYMRRTPYSRHSGPKRHESRGGCISGTRACVRAPHPVSLLQNPGSTPRILRKGTKKKPCELLLRDVSPRTKTHERRIPSDMIGARGTEE